MDSAILTKVKIMYSYWLPVVSCSRFEKNTGVRLLSVFRWFFGLEVEVEANTGFCCFALFITGTSLVCVMPGSCSFVLCCCLLYLLRCTVAVAIGYNSYCFDGLNCS